MLLLAITLFVLTFTLLGILVWRTLNAEAREANAKADYLNDKNKKGKH